MTAAMILLASSGLSADTCSTSDSPVSDASAVTALRNVSLDTAAPSFFAAAAITLSDVTNSARWVAYRANAVSPDSTPSTPALSGVLSARRACMRDGSPTINATMTLSSTATATMINELARYRHTASTSRGDGSSSMTSFSLGGHAERSVQPNRSAPLTRAAAGAGNKIAPTGDNCGNGSSDNCLARTDRTAFRAVR